MHRNMILTANASKNSFQVICLLLSSRGPMQSTYAVAIQSMRHEPASVGSNRTQGWIRAFANNIT
jgi:hypothetical protein